MADMDITKIADGSDIPQLTIKMPSSTDGTLFSPKMDSWEIVLWVHTNKRVVVRYNASKGECESIGEIQANCSIGEDKIVLYIKASEMSFGKGELKGQMTVFIPNTNYKNEEQVGKTLETKLGIHIV